MNQQKPSMENIRYSMSLEIRPRFSGNWVYSFWPVTQVALCRQKVMCKFLKKTHTVYFENTPQLDQSFLCQLHHVNKFIPLWPSFLTLWPWLLIYDHDLQTWPKHSSTWQCQILSLYVCWYRCESGNRHSHSVKTIIPATSQNADVGCKK